MDKSDTTESSFLHAGHPCRTYTIKYGLAVDMITLQDDPTFCYTDKRRTDNRHTLAYSHTDKRRTDKRRTDNRHTLALLSMKNKDPCSVS